MAPYQFDTFSNRPYVGTIADLMQEPGRAQARAAEIGGQANAQALMQMGQGIGGAIQHVTDPRFQMEQEQVAAMQRAKMLNGTINQLMTQAMVQHPDGYVTYDRSKLRDLFTRSNVPVTAQEQAFKSLDEVDSSMQKFATARTDSLADLAHGVLSNGATPQALALGIALAKANHRLSDEDVMPLIQAAASGADLKGMLTQVRSMSEKYKPIVLPRPGAQLASPEGEPLATVPQLPEKPTEATLAADAANPKSQTSAQSAAALKLLKPDKPDTASQEDQRYEKIIAARTQQQPVSPEDSAWASAYEKRRTLSTTTSINLRNAADKDTITDQAEQVRTGMLPPSMLSKRSSTYNAILAEANRQEKEETGKPLNLGQLELNYRAAQRFVASLNGPNMVRFQALGKSVVNTIDEVRSLAEELKQGGIQKWNSAKRSTILQVYGNSPQSEIAVRYLAAVNTLKEEYANLANGGYAPTEPAWKLANQQINGDYGVKDLNASLTESQRLINFRLSGFTGLAPILSGTEPSKEPGAPPPASAAGVPKEGDIKPIPGFPGMEQTYRHGKWIRTK